MPVNYYIKLKDNPSVLIDARSITPDSFAGKKINEILLLKILEGGKPIALQDLFDVEGPSEGSITINGDAGHFIGYKMRGGNITIRGNARNYLGAKMKDGTIEVFGNAGHWIGAKLLGEKPGKGMKGGTITIHGNAGSEIGSGMKGGTIIIDGSAKNSAGNYMTGGTIIVKGNGGLYPGLRMSGGRIVINGSVQALLPSFYVDSIIQPLKVKGITFSKSFMSFIGDALIGGHGVLQVSYDDNKELLEEFRKLLV